MAEREEGNDRFWSICCLGKYEKQPDGHSRFIYKIRPELQAAFDETGVLEGVDVSKALELNPSHSRALIGLVAIVGGLYNLFTSFRKKDNGNE